LAWDAASGSLEELDMCTLQAEAESMVPTGETGWTREMVYGQNAAAAYAIRTWLTDDPQEAGWAARQVYELADYAVLQGNPEFDLNAPDAEARVLASDIVQEALGALARSLDVVEASPANWQQLRADAEADGGTLAAAVP
jgi:hypothetical protein